MSHYYNEKVDLESKPSFYETKVLGKTFKFNTDSGVFCNKYLDYGTKVLLENLKIPSVYGDILDLGCGYGPVGVIVGYNNSDRQVLSCDVNERAVKLANDNFVLNKVFNAKAIKSNIYSDISGKFALIVTNPPIRAGKKVVHDFFIGAYEHLVEDGELWVVIQKKQGAPSALKKLEEVFGNCVTVTKDKGYYVLKSKKS